jgi:hypothetical protein
MKYLSLALSLTHSLTHSQRPVPPSSSEICAPFAFLRMATVCVQATLESVYKEQEGSLENMLWGGKETEDTVTFLEACIKKDAAPNPFDP